MFSLLVILVVFSGMARHEHLSICTFLSALQFHSAQICVGHLVESQFPKSDGEVLHFAVTLWELGLNQVAEKVSEKG